MRPLNRLFMLALALAMAILPTWAQYEDDEQTDDHTLQDQQYLERRQPKDNSPAAPADPSREQAEEEREFLKYVDGLIRDRNYRAASSQRYRVQTDDPRLDAEASAAFLEQFRVYFDSFWAPRVPMVPYEKQSRVFLFYSFHKYNKLLGGDFSRKTNRPKGHYGSWFDVVTIHTDADLPGDLPDTLIHEAAHQLMEQRFDWKRGQPLWIGEGMASYFGFTLTNKDAEFEIGRVGGKHVRLYRDGKIYRGGQARLRLNFFRDAIKHATMGDTLYGPLLSINDPARFYGQNANVNYAASWLLVHYLFHGDDGRHSAAFSRYLEAEMNGEGGVNRLMSEIGMTPDGLDRAVAAYAKRLKVR